MTEGHEHTRILARLAREAMAERGLLVDLSPEAVRELAGIGVAFPDGDGWQDLTSKPWCSIDNDDSRDLDQLTFAERGDGDTVRVFVAIADVDAAVRAHGAIDDHAAHNTTSVYTPACMFPMLPVELSEDMTSLGEGVDRAAVVVQFSVDVSGECVEEDVFRAVVRNRAKLAYSSVGAWLSGDGPLPAAAARHGGMEEPLRIQDAAAQALRRRRELRGALQFEDRDAGAVFEDGAVADLRIRPRNRATQLIENFMITANGVANRFLRTHGFSTMQRVVRSPERWEALAELADEYGERLPVQPDNLALRHFLAKQHQADPTTFPDLSLTVIKLMGRGEYVVTTPGRRGPGHFALAVRDYMHSTAPNRRFPDLVTQRQLKAALDGARTPYGDDELTTIAEHCSVMEVVVDKLERRLRKSAAALMLEDRIGESFDAIVTGASPNATWVRLLHMPVEGRVVRRQRGLRVGKRVRVRLVRTDVEAGFIDFARD